MLHEITKLQSVSFWLTSDLITYQFFLEIKDLERIFREKGIKNVLDLVNSVTKSAKDAKESGLWKSFLVKWDYEEYSFFQSDIILKHGISSQQKLGIEGRNSKMGIIDPLTIRERQILRLLGDGLTQKEICEVLKIKLATFKCHRNHLYAKMNFTSKTSLLIWYRKYSEQIHMPSVQNFY